jgi:hypothetical protein
VSQAGFRPPDRAEKVRRWSAAPVVLLASVLGASCLLNVVVVARSLLVLSAMDARFVGWVGLGAFLAIGLAAVALLSADRIGSGPFLAVGAVAGVFGLSLGHHVNGGEQLTLAVLVCGLAVGCLLGGAAAVSSTLPRPWAEASVVAWTGPLVVAWPLLTLAIGHADPFPDLVAHPPVWVLAVVTVLVVSWGVLTMLVEPLPEPRRAGAHWEEPWWAVLLVCAAAILLATLLGFDPQISLVWLRPIVITATAVVVAGWGVAALVIRDQSVRLGYVAVSAVAWILPATAGFAVDVAASHGGPGWPITVLFIALAAVGAAVGSRGTSAVVPIGFALIATAAVGTWVMSDEPWVMFAAVGPLVGLGTAVLVTGMRVVGSDPYAVRLVAMALISSLVLGAVVAIPLDWAMLGDVPGNPGDAFASGRLDAGLAVAVASLAAACTWVVRRRLSWRAEAPWTPARINPLERARKVPRAVR